MNKTEIQNLIKELIEKTTIPVNNICIDEERASTNSNGDKSMWFSVEVSQPNLFLDRGGEALSAINHLVRRIIENKNTKKEDENKSIDLLIDINGFQKKKVDNIRAIAHMMAERARYFKSNIEIDPMPAFERRIVHEFLSNVADLKTESQGEGVSRRVVIKYIGNI